MEKIEIIDIALDQSIDSIIADDITQITKQNQTDIDAAINNAKQIAEARNKKTQAEQDVITATLKAYTALSDADTRGETVAGKDLLMMVTPHIATMNSLVQRLKSHIKNNQPGIQLLNLRQGKDTYYYLEQIT